eukprot:280225-Chlamydomonas_euryale.AAC.2
MDLLVRLRMLVTAGRMRERENNASLAPRVGSDARLEGWEHSERGLPKAPLPKVERYPGTEGGLRTAFRLSCGIPTRRFWCG